MADNIAVTAGSGETVLADELTDATLGTGKVQFVKIMDGTLDSSNKAAVSAAGLKVDLGSDNDVTLATLPDTSGGDLAATSAALGATADAAATAGGTGSISAKLRNATALLGTIDTDTGDIATSVAVMDDWDESDRAKVNIVVGQAGVTAGAGAVGLNTPRVTLASDDPAVALLTTIDADTGNLSAMATNLATLAGAVAGTELQVDIVSGAGSGGTAQADDADFTAGTTQGTPAMGVYQSTPGNVTDGDLGVVRITQDRKLVVYSEEIPTQGRAAAASSVPVVISTEDKAVLDNLTTIDADTGNIATNTSAATTALQIIDDWDETDRAKVNIIVGQAGVAAGAGAVGVTVPRVTLASDDPAVALLGTIDADTGNIAGSTSTTATNTGNAVTALQLIDNTIIVDDAAFTPATTSVNMAGFQADETATDSVDEGDAGAARMTLDRKVIVTPQPHTTGGLSIFRSIDLDESEEEVKASAGQVYGMWVSNLATSTRFVKFYNATAANVTVGTTTPVLTVPIPGNTSDDITGFFSSTHGIAFGTAISVAATTGVADNDTGAPGANEVVINVFYA